MPFFNTTRTRTHAERRSSLFCFWKLKYTNLQNTPKGKLLWCRKNQAGMSHTKIHKNKITLEEIEHIKTYSKIRGEIHKVYKWKEGANEQATEKNSKLKNIILLFSCPIYLFVTFRERRYNAQFKLRWTLNFPCGIWMWVAHRWSSSWTRATLQGSTWDISVVNPLLNIFNVVKVHTRSYVKGEAATSVVLF